MLPAPTWPSHPPSNTLLRLTALLSAIVVILALATIGASQKQPRNADEAATIAAKAKSIDLSQTAGGMSVYLGVVPAADLKAQAVMRAGVPSGSHAYHIVAA